MRFCKIALIVSQSMNIVAIIIINTLLMTISHPSLENVVTVYGNKMEEICFKFTAVLFLVIAIILTVVDVMLLKRLKQFYPTFYEKEKMKIIISNTSMVIFVGIRILVNTIMQTESYVDDLNLSYQTDSWFFPIHQAIVLLFGFYLPNFAIIYSFMFAFS
jgi:hypothetical protein